MTLKVLGLNLFRRGVRPESGTRWMIPFQQEIFQHYQRNYVHLRQFHSLDMDIMPLAFYPPARLLEAARAG